MAGVHIVAEMNGAVAQSAERCPECGGLGYHEHRICIHSAAMSGTDPPTGRWVRRRPNLTVQIHGPADSDSTRFVLTVAVV